MGKTITEKILSRASGKNVEQGELVVAEVDLAMAHDGTAPLAIKMFREMGGELLWNAKKVILVIDHVAPSATEGTSSLHKLMRQFSAEQKIENFYDVGVGVCHQLMVEKHVEPGMVVVGADSHTCTYGALGAFSTGIGSTEVAAVFKTGKLWFKVPETLKINLDGEMPPHVTPKDVILYLIGQIGADGATYKAVEFSGEAVKHMSVDGRLTLCNMVVEMGAKNGLVEPDETTEKYILEKRRNFSKALKNDPDAEFVETREYDVSKIEPQIACPPTVDNVKPVKEVEGLDIHQVFLGSCTDGRVEDLKEAAEILAGKRISPHVRMIVVPASVNVYLEALEAGFIKTFLEAGCTLCNPGCGPCVGAHQGIPAPGEVVLSTSNRNFVGRMGCAEADIYLVSPKTAAVSALTGKITDPQGWRG
ncbi:3-isopropylmalate dehydratase large subunit [Candidatus Hecatella orcuttiae]|jgi:3-isopropylmalate/(R)-2-methylmalate dehydratase large subunit|uniref:3-isopropylmalate dehydratase large subunit n=1 Tax=Candidatus Hecatella orcuttiae TaxID=1935119 RepID=UPI0028680FBF|nr:3-isopropylmalate dehydratase large subunit [Candidatus Hecatella orcuttiae]